MVGRVNSKPRKPERPFFLATQQVSVGLLLFAVVLKPGQPSWIWTYYLVLAIWELLIILGWVQLARSRRQRDASR